MMTLHRQILCSIDRPFITSRDEGSTIRPRHRPRAQLAARGFAMLALALLCVACQTLDADSVAHSRKGHHLGNGSHHEETRDAAGEHVVRQQLAQTPDCEVRFALLDGVAREDERAGRMVDYYHVLDLIESDGAISPGRRSLAASELAEFYLAEGELARGGRMIDDAKRYADEVKDSEREHLPLDPTFAALHAEAELAWRFRGQYDVALHLGREATDLGWRDLANSALSPARREAAVNELTSAAPREVSMLIRWNRAAEALSQVDELRWDLDNGSSPHSTPLQRAEVARARAIALTAFDDYDAALASINSAIEGFRAAGLTPASTQYAESLRLRLLIALAMERIGDYRADLAGLQVAASANPLEGTATSVVIDRSLAFAVNGDWTGAQRSIAAEPQLNMSSGNSMSYRRQKHNAWSATNRAGIKFRSALAMLYRLEDPRGGVSAAEIADYVDPWFNSYDDWDDDNTRGGTIDDGVLALSMARLMSKGVQGGALAFRVAELLHSNATQGAMNDGAARLAAQTPGLRALVEEEATLRYQLATSATPSPGTEDKLRALHARIVAEFPRYQQLIAPAIPKPEDVAGVLHTNEAYIDLYAGRDASYAFVVRSDAPLHAVVLPVTREAIARQVAALRAAFDAATPPEQPGDLAGFDLVAAAQLYRALIAPIESDLQGAKTVYLSTSGILSSIPYEVLLRRPALNLAGADWWINSTTPARVPSASALVSARAVRGAHASDALVAFADPSFDGSATAPQTGVANSDTVATAGARAFPVDVRTLSFDYRRVAPLPETLGEANAIAKALGASQDSVISGLAASRSHVLAQDLSNERVVLFATHGVLPGEVPGLRNSGLALAYEGRGLPDSVLTADDIVTLRLNADWVVLSACNTGLATGGAGDSVSALTRAFFSAGARTLLVTQWAVESRSAALVTTSLFEAYARDPALSKADALAQAERAMAAGKDGSLYRHPYFWGAYFLAGDGRR